MFIVSRWTVILNASFAFQVNVGLVRLVAVTEVDGRSSIVVGSGIFADVRAAMKAAGYDYMSLAVIKKNEEAVKFWESQGFSEDGESVSTEGYEVYKFARDI